MTQKIKESELILNADGSVYHLHLLPHQIADDVILVGDPQRVEVIGNYFDTIECKVENREFITITGSLKGKRISVVGTGIGTDNIDIVLNEIDAAVNIDLEKREIKEEKRVLNFIRLGTSGALQEEIPVDSLVFSKYGLGFDNLLHFYKNGNQIIEKEMLDALMKHGNWNTNFVNPYIIACSNDLEKRLGEGLIKGITATASGFYGPQGRVLRLALADADMNQKLETFRFGSQKVTNFEMETSALYGLSKMLGHNAVTICAIIANRYKKEYSKDYKKTVVKMVELVLERIVEK
jgi:uridine phosphorylase